MAETLSMVALFALAICGVFPCFRGSATFNFHMTLQILLSCCRTLGAVTWGTFTVENCPFTERVKKVSMDMSKRPQEAPMIFVVKVAVVFGSPRYKSQSRCSI